MTAPARGPARSVDGEPTLFPRLPFEWRVRTEAFLADEQIQRAVGEATDVKDRGRRAACASAFGDKLAALRSHAADVRQHAIDHIDHYLEVFVQAAGMAGARVHFAVDAAEACAIALEVARSHDAKLCVKSKSMVTEEIRLLEAFEEAGIETVETDLGEFILQLDGDAPSHIVMPMIHKDRRAVSRAFVREIGGEQTEDPERLTAVARKHLRGIFRRADLGITGGNFLVAETGTIVVCTNEGNGRFCATAPPHQIAVVGIEKVVADLDGLAPLLKLLARSATGQPLTVYTQFLTGPRRDGETDGPETLDVILLDGGRSTVLARPDVRSALRCIRCGACQNVCPVYRKATGHAYGSVYGGPIGAVITPLLRGIANYPDLPAASSLCGACREACPVDIDLPGMLVALRADRVVARNLPRGKRWLLRALRSALATPRRMRGAQRLVSFLLGVAADEGMIRDLPGPARGWTRERDLPAPARESFRARWRRLQRGGTR